MDVLFWCAILGILLPPIALTVSLIGLAGVPTKRQRHTRWRRLARVSGALCVGSVILLGVVILFLIGLSHWPAD
jgi:uncharacterized membrane protein YozB (DUF420 family)